MTESNTSNPDPDVPTDNAVENSREPEAGTDHDHSEGDSDDATDTSAMARALKHELEQKDMTVEVEDDGETVSAEKLDQSYRIRPDGTVEGNGVLKDGIENIVAALDLVQDTETENPEIDADSDTGDDSDDSASNADENDSSKESKSSEGVTDENEVKDESEDGVSTSESDMPTAPAETDETAATVEDDTATEQNEETEEEANEEEAESLPTGNVGLFEASIEVGHLQEVIDTAHAVVDECRVHLDTDGLVIRAVDPANVAMVNEQVSADAFEAYDTDCGEIGINLERLDEVVGIADNDDDLVQFDLDPKTRKLDVQVNAVEYTLALIDPEAIRAEPDIPDLDLPATVSMDEAEFKRAIRAADMVSDHITLQVDEREECFIANAEGDTDDVDLELACDDLEDADWGSAYSLFSLEYLKDLRKPIPTNTVVRMQLGEEFPAKLTFELADGAVDVEFMVAPRIQSD
jgi:proliferating cell nuclear antigen